MILSLASPITILNIQDLAMISRLKFDDFVVVSLKLRLQDSK